jgi:hypothetical protein
MKCDEFLIAMETGGFYRRMRARRHAASCPACGRILESFSVAKEGLVTHDPLSAHLRKLWERAAVETASPRWAIPWWAKLAGGLVATAVVVLVIKVGVIKKPATSSVPQMAAEGQLTIVVLDSPEELDRMTRAVDQLAGELKDIAALADRVDAKHQVAMTLDTFNK